MNILWLIAVGAVIGIVARFLMPGRDPIGFVGTILLGIVGAVLGGWLWDTVRPSNDNEGVAVFAGIVTAMILLFIYRKVTYGRHDTSHVAR
ncbi:MAG: GlsB/YeaQ/YmgE family stress response membrane protein [Actinomycetota bacterium]|nr:GlsB/YeaQ/YmgE family stress response membrane protein [Actinomycetota bacterium]